MFEWESLITCEQTLRQSVADEYDSYDIYEDISRLKVTCCGHKSPGKFERVQDSSDTAIHFYQHAMQVV